MRKRYKDDPEYQSDVLDGLLTSNARLAELTEKHDAKIEANGEKVKQLDSDVSVLKFRVGELEKSSEIAWNGMCNSRVIFSYC